jgi:hypothetical protein
MGKMLRDKKRSPNWKSKLFSKSLEHKRKFSGKKSLSEMHNQSRQGEHVFLKVLTI